MRKPDWPGEWKDLASRFDMFQSQHIRATWFSESLNWDGTDVGEQWYVQDDAYAVGPSVSQTKDCESLCRLAGAMLLQSPRLKERLSAKVRSRSNDMWRWLYFLKDEKNAIGKLSPGSAFANGRKIETQSGDIENLAATCGRACIECAAEEVRQEGQS